MGVSNALIYAWKYYGGNNNNKKMFFQNKHWLRHAHWARKYAVNEHQRWQALPLPHFPYQFSIPFDDVVNDVVLHNVESFSF